jgi:uncharacterized membrane protein YeaQ/YmgE (transglycosylase-associated protein family)
MDADLQAILIVVLLGAIAGWLAGLIVKGGGFGLIVNIILGIGGAFVGKYLFAQLGISIGSGLIPTMVSAVAGAVVLVVIVSLLRKIAN